MDARLIGPMLESVVNMLQVVKPKALCQASIPHPYFCHFALILASSTWKFVSRLMPFNAANFATIAF